MPGDGRVPWAGENGLELVPLVLMRSASASGVELSAERSKGLAGNIVRDLWVAVVGFDPSWKVMLWNERAEELFGLPAREAKGRSLAETGILSETGPVERLMARVDQAGDLIVPGLGPDGTTPLLHRLRRLDGNGNGSGSAGFVCVSALLAQEEAIRDREFGELFGLTPLWALAPAVGALIGEMRHPLQIILQNGELLLDQVTPGGPDGEAGSRARDIVRATEDLSRLVKRADDLARSVQPQIDLRTPGRERRKIESQRSSRSYPGVTSR